MQAGCSDAQRTRGKRRRRQQRQSSGMRPLVLLPLLVGRAAACSNMLVGRSASASGSPQIAYTSDAGFQYGGMGHYPAADHPAGTMRDIFNEDSGAYSGQIVEAPHTYNAIAYHGGMNEHQLAISETTFGGLAALHGQKGLIDYGTLMDLALQRCRTAREAIRFIDEILSEYGYASSGESISIADTTEVWLMELVSKGAGEKGVVWVARKVPDDSACSHANQARIRTWPRDDKVAMWANDTVYFAVKKGLYPKDADPLQFSFSDTFCPVDFAGARLAEARVYNMLKEVTDDPSFASDYLSYAQGYNLTNRMPLFVKAKAPLTVNDTSWLMRTRFTGTWFDERKDVGAGASHAEYRQRPLMWTSNGKKFVNERTVGVQQNAFHFVANPRVEFTNTPIGGVIWSGCDDQSLAVRFPAYASSTALPPTWIEGPTQNRTVFKMRSSHWAFNMVANFAYAHWETVLPVVQAKIVATEATFASELATMDAKARALLHGPGGSSAKAIEALTAFTVRTGDDLVDEWNAFFGELFVRFSDGFDASAKPRSAKQTISPTYMKGGTSTVDVQENGYSADVSGSAPDSSSSLCVRYRACINLRLGPVCNFATQWYARIVEDAGGKYHIPASIEEVLDHRLSTDRLQFL